MHSVIVGASDHKDNIELCSIDPDTTTTTVSSMGNSQYATIPEQEGLVVGSGASSSNPRARRFTPALGAASLLVISAAILGTVTLLNNHSSANVSFMNEASLEGLLKKGSEARSCLVKECYKSNCNAKVASFICLTHNGGPHMGW